MYDCRSETLRGRCGWLALATFVAWLLALVPALQLFGAEGVVAAGLSAIFCFVPGCLVFWLVSGLAPATGQVRAVISGTLLRVGAGLAGAFVMQQFLGFAPRNYLVWLGLFYLITLSVETYQILPRRRGLPSG